MKVYNLENIKSAAELKHRTEVISMNERSIIVLDTFTGIAQKLQAVSISLFHLDIEKVMNQLQDFENDCGNWLDNLLSSEMQKAEAAKEIKVHIDQISRLCNENPNIIDDHEIMAHGAMISSLILSHYLEECTKKNFILNSCHFMRLGLDGNKLKLYGLMIANSLVALSGGILAQYQGFADVGIGTGTIITGLASIIIGEAVIGKKKIIKATTMVIIGTVIYRAIIALSLKLGMNASDLKLITSILIVIIIYLKLKKESLKKGGVVNA